MKSSWAILTAILLTPMLSGIVGGAPARMAEEAVSNACVVGSPPEERALSRFYKKYCISNGIPVVSSGEVPDAALEAAADIASHMLSVMPLVRDRLVSIGSRIAVIGQHQVTSNIPEYKFLALAYPDLDWRTRGIATRLATIPVTSGAEENLLCYDTDRYWGENILVHEFSHTIKVLGIQTMDPSFGTKVQQAYDHAKSTGLWASTYSMSNAEEYWAEGVQSYFDANKMVDPPNGIHNGIDTRIKLKKYDPDLFFLIDSAFHDIAWRPRCP
jgi:alpha-glucosidase